MRKITFGVITTLIVAVAATVIFYACNKEDKSIQTETSIGAKQQKAPAGNIDTVCIEHFVNGRTFCSRTTSLWVRDYYTNKLLAVWEIKYEIIDCKDCRNRASADIEAKLKTSVVTGMLSTDEDGNTISDEERREILADINNYEITVDGEPLTPAFSKEILLDEDNEDSLIIIDYDVIITEIWSSWVAILMSK